MTHPCQEFNNCRSFLFENTIKVLKELYKEYDGSGFVERAKQTIASEEHLDAMLEYIIELEKDRDRLNTLLKIVEKYHLLF